MYFKFIKYGIPYIYKIWYHINRVAKLLKLKNKEEIMEKDLTRKIETVKLRQTDRVEL